MAGQKDCCENACRKFVPTIAIHFPAQPSFGPWNPLRGLFADVYPARRPVMGTDKISRSHHEGESTSIAPNYLWSPWPKSAEV
jgi:hypothetical protein